jgi:hypothetical protein
MRARRRRRTQKRGAGLIALLLVAGAAGYGVVWNVHRHHPGSVVSESGGGVTATSPTTGPHYSAGSGGSGSGAAASSTVVQEEATQLGAAGVQAPWVVRENNRPGTTAWRIAGTPPGLLAGYADHTSAVVGDHVQLFVTTDAASYQVTAYRVGWYGGAGAREVWASAPLTGATQPTCPLDSVTGMVHCDNWTPSLNVAITSDFLPGDYLFKLLGSGGQASYIPLTVRDPNSHAAYLVENDIYTWQAWNPWGGYDFYQGIGACPPGVYPVCNRARVVSFDRPYGYGQGAADFLTNEFPLIQFMEQHGLDVTYETTADFEQYPQSLLAHKAVLSLGHDECWSYHERVGAVTAERSGVNLVFFGASPVLRHVRLQASPLGSYREEIDYRNSASDPLDGVGDPLEVTGNTWQDAPASWSEVPFTGAEYTGYVRPGDTPVDMVVTDTSSWLFTGTGLSDGAHLPGLLASDFDQYQPGVSPQNVEIMGHSPMPLGEVQTNTYRPASDITYYSDSASGAGVFDTGTVAWIPDLGSSTALQQMTGNLLHLFGQGPAGRISPSVPNWADIY